MMDIKTQKICAAMVFFVGILMLISHLLSISAGITFPPAVFWISIILIIGSLIFQIIKLSSSGSFSNFIIFEILVANFAFHMIYVLPYPGLYGGSATPDLWSLNRFIEDETFSLSTKPFPGFEILSGSFSLISGISTFNVVKFLPSLLDTALILMLYLLFKNILNNAKGALLSVLLFSTLFYHIWFYSTFHWEILGILLLVTTLYLYFKHRVSNNTVFEIALSFLCLISLIFSHHLSSLIICIFLVIFVGITYIRGKVYKSEKQNVKIAFVLSVLTIVFAYYTFVYTAALGTIITFARSLLDLGRLGQETYSLQVVVPNTTLRQYVEQYGFYVFHAVFGGIIGCYLLFTDKKRSFWYTFTAIYLFFWAIIAIMLMYVIPRTSANLDSERALIYGWLVGFIPVVVVALESKYRWFKRISIGILVLFIFFGIFQISPIQWNPMAEEPNNTANNEEMILAKAVDFKDSIGLFSGSTTLMAIYNENSFYNQITYLPSIRNYLITLSIRNDYASGYEDFPDLEWVILRKTYLQREIALDTESYYSDEDAKQLSENIIRLSEDGYDGYQRRNLIYVSNALVVFR